MNTPPLIIAVLVGIAYGAIRSYYQDKNEDKYKKQKKKRSNPYLESIVVSLAVYLLISSLFYN